MEKFISVAVLSKYLPDSRRRKWFVFHGGKGAGLVYIGIYRFRIAFNWRNDIARILYRLKIKPYWTTNIDGQLECGYGGPSHNGFWSYPLPRQHKVYQVI